ncbi:MAG TPA: hypothetical protein VFC99_10535 [Acidimicrobiia bacterium]|nr:hypothetical protein [Acidimicrobiia bacterium]
MGRVERIVAAGGGVAEVVGASTAWRAAEIVTDAFARPDERPAVRTARLLGNYFRLRLVMPSLINRERTAVVGAGGVRPLPLAVTAVVAGWLGPRLPRVVQFVVVASVAGAALHRNRLRRMLWVVRGIRRHEPGAVVVGEFSAADAGAGIAFAVELVGACGPHTAMAATVQRPVGDRRARAQVRLYERRLGFRVVERKVLGGDELVLLVRPPTPVAVSPPLASAV